MSVCRCYDCSQPFTMKIALLCLLLAPLLQGASIQPDTSIQPVQPIQPVQHRPKRFILDWFDDDDYFDDYPLLRRRRPSRRTIQLAQMIRQLAGPNGLTPAQVQNMMQNLQSMQMMNNMQQLTQMQNLQQLQMQATTPRPANQG